MIVIYQKIAPSIIKAEGTKLVKQAEEFFQKNRRRKTCTIGVWYGKQIKVKKDSIKADIEAAVEVAIAHSMG